MQPIPQGQGRSLRVAGVMLALLALLVVVAFASRGGFGHTSDTGPAPAFVSWAMSIFLVVFVVMTPVAIYIYLQQTREHLERGRTRSFQARVLRSLVWVFLLGVVFLVRLYFGDRFHLSRGVHQLFFGRGTTPGGSHHGKPAPPPTFQWPVLWAALALGAVALGAWLWWRRTHPNAAVERDSPTVADDIALSIGDAIDDLEAEPDARRAVIAAYARMERAFGRHGLRRERSETPTEYLRRILLSLTSQAEAVRRLTGLFEQAKFSAHAIDGSMKQEAIDALRVIRDDLLAASA